jgi:nucleotide-binding universal stress UspA family protein
MSNAGHLRFRRILCTLEFSEAGADLVRYADTLASRLNAELTLLRVASGTGLELSALQPCHSAMRLAEERGRTVRYALESYPGEGPLRETARLVRKENFDLLVLPALRRSLLRRWLGFGPAGAIYLRSLWCPVIAGADFGRRYHPWNIRNVLCATSIEARTSQVVSVAEVLSEHLGADLTVVHADDPAKRVMDLQRETGAALIVAGKEASGYPVLFADRSACPIVTV